MRICLAEQWQLRRFTDGEALLYHPCTGDLFALPCIPASLVGVLSDIPRSLDDILDAAVLHCKVTGVTVETPEMRQHLDEFIRLGVVISIDD